MNRTIVAAIAAVAALATAPVEAQVFTVDTVEVARDVSWSLGRPVSEMGQPVQHAMQWQMFGAGSPYHTSSTAPIPLLTIEYDGTLSFGLRGTVNFNSAAAVTSEDVGNLPTRGYLIAKLGGRVVLLPYMLPEDIKVGP